MHWSNLLHIYQPPTQLEEVVHKIAEESYGPLARGLDKHRDARFVLNINGVLTEWLARLGYEEILELFRAAAERGQIEFTGSAKYHTILPLLPKEEMVRQISLNEETNKKYFGDAYAPKGFFPPELCYSHTLGELLIELGYEWVVMDEIGYNGRFGNVRYDRIYTLKTHAPFSIFFRKRQSSDFVSMTKLASSHELVQGLTQLSTKDEAYIFTAMDGETYGHHKKGFDRILFHAYNHLHEYKMDAVLLSELSERIYPREEVDPLSCSWSTSIQEIKDGIPFGLWRNVNNEIHNLQWALTNLALEAVRSSKNALGDDEVERAAWEKSRHILDTALHSDQYWWASGNQGTGTIGTQWLPHMIIAGAELLCEAIHAAPKLHDQYEKDAGRLRGIIEGTVWDWDKNKKYVHARRLKFV